MADIEGSNGQRTEFRAVGRANVPGRLSYVIAKGKAKLGTDAAAPGMLHAKFLRKPTMLDLGTIETYAVETRSGNACYGASGISHCMAAPLLPVCAVANAIGQWIAPPVTPDKVLKALGKA
jgi:CO/xanthine dehydrogenase Mo-binding subunit